jgi:hypothetical protein
MARLRTLIAAGLIAALLLIASAPLAAAKASATVVLTSSSRDVPVGGSTILSGAVRIGAGVGLATAPVEIWVRPVGSVAWRHTATTWTNAVGNYAVRQNYSQASVTMARFPARSGIAAADSAGRVIAVHQSFAAVGIKGCAEIPSYGWVEYAGRTSPAAAGSYALAQWRYSAGWPWKTGAVVQVGANGEFRALFGLSHFPYDARWVLNGRTNVTGTASPTYTGVVPVGNFTDEPDCEQFVRT